MSNKSICMCCFLLLDHLFFRLNNDFFLSKKNKRRTITHIAWRLSNSGRRENAILWVHMRFLCLTVTKNDDIHSYDTLERRKESLPRERQNTTLKWFGWGFCSCCCLLCRLLLYFLLFRFVLYFNCMLIVCDHTVVSFAVCYLKFEYVSVPPSMHILIVSLLN